MKTKYKVIIASAVVLILAGTSIYSIAAEKLPQYRKIVVASAGRTSMRKTLSLKGYIEPNAKQEIKLDANQKVEEVYVREGQDVKAGDVLLKSDNADMVYNLKSEELNLRVLQSQLSEIIKYENKDKKDLEYTVTQAEIQYRSSVNDLNEAKIKFEQDQKLYQEGFISRAELDSSAKGVSRLEDSMKLSEIQLDKAKEADESYASQRLQQIDKLNSEIELAKMNIDILKNKVDMSTKALIAGKIIKCKIQNNQYPAEDNSTIQIYDLSRYIIKAYVKQNEAVLMAEGQKASITLKGLEHKTYVGTVVEIEDSAELPQNGSGVPMVEIKAAVDEPDQDMRVGFEAEIKIDLNAKEDVTVVNFQAIVEDYNGDRFVYLFKDNKAERKPVKTGMESGYLVEIVEGLIPGDQYIVNPPERVQDENTFRLWSWGYELQ